MKDEKGFTLIELSVVLLVIALLVGGVLAGQSLVRNGRIRMVLSDEQNYAAAIRTFRDKYAAMPGDFSQATTLWGAASSCPSFIATAAPATSPSPTCNGDGDGTISVNYEMVLFWQHLSNAGLVSGRYTGGSVDNQSDRDAKIGLNYPATAIPGIGFSALTLTDSIVSTWLWTYNGTYGHELVLGSYNPAVPFEPGAAAITSAEAQQIDTKLDDGRPATGIIRVYNSIAWTNCASGGSKTNPGAAVYNLAYTANLACGVVFLIDGPQ